MAAPPGSSAVIVMIAGLDVWFWLQDTPVREELPLWDAGMVVVLGCSWWWGNHQVRRHAGAFANVRASDGDRVELVERVDVAKQTARICASTGEKRRKTQLAPACSRSRPSRSR